MKKYKILSGGGRGGDIILLIVVALLGYIKIEVNT